ncbi:YceI family protein [Acidicapsa dinghuensis]|uniref:YceI family protein n=1 Tax=Acidicapsa dinghuensis TaxID=2218256 RepID=A0ABW1ECA2_9BACT|nr:YceI family protein [Acidicapsa dinghuensis]
MKTKRTMMRAERLKAWLIVVTAMLTAVPVICSGQGTAKQLHLHLDPTATTVQFTLKDTIHTVHGTFHMHAGDVYFDPKTGEAHGKIEVDATSGESGNDTRDGKMKREYLEVGQFPVAMFEPHLVTGSTGVAFDEKFGTQTISVSGNFTLHGASHAMVMQFLVQHDGQQAMATTHFLIPYVAWGIKDPSFAVVRVEKEVGIDVKAKGTLTSE